jgi:hypothetical protein
MYWFDLMIIARHPLKQWFNEFKKASAATVYNQGGSAAFLSIFSYVVQFLNFRDQSRTRLPPKFESLLLYLCF